MYSVTLICFYFGRVISELMLCEILWQLSEDKLDLEKEIQSNNLPTLHETEFDEDAEMQLRWWNQMVRKGDETEVTESFTLSASQFFSSQSMNGEKEEGLNSLDVQIHHSQVSSIN
jgi:hypothetical protein